LTLAKPFTGTSPFPRAFLQKRAAHNSIFLLFLVNIATIISKSVAGLFKTAACHQATLSKNFFRGD
jgi:hypothetical protein